MSGSSRSSELINHTSFKATASASCSSSTPASSSRVSSSISTEAQQETGHNRESTTQGNSNINSNSSASARGGYTPPPQSVTTTVTTTNAVTNETKRKTAAFASEGKVNNNPVHDSLRLSEGLKTKGLEQDSSSHHRMLARSNPGVHTIGGDIDSDTDPGLFYYIHKFYKSRILQRTIELHNFSTIFSNVDRGKCWLCHHFLCPHLKYVLMLIYS